MDINRRAFLQQVAAFSAGIAIVPMLRSTPPAYGATTPSPLAGPAAQTGQSIISVAKGKDYAALVTKVLLPLGGIAAFVKSGDRVVIKPNIGWDRKPEQAANTHPDVVKAMVAQCLDAGAKEVKVFDRTCNNKNLCYANSGIQQAVESLKSDRAVCEFIDDRKFMPVDIEGGKAVNRWEFYKDALDTDVYINVPIAKHHGLSKLTLGLKNVMGVIGGNRGKIHQEIGQKLADLNRVVGTKLVVIDATRILLRHGPQGGNLDDVKVLDTLIASTDPVAADAYATTLFGLKPSDITSTVAGHASGLGEMDLAKVKIIEA